MALKVERSELVGSVVPPPNKSITHRAFFLSTLAPGESIVRNALLSRDTLATKSACEVFGAEFSEVHGGIRIRGPERISARQTYINAENSGTTIRISAAISALLPGVMSLSGDASLRKRPMQHLIDALERAGARCSSANGSPPMTVMGKLTKNKVSINGTKSSQFVSALAMIAPKMEGGMDLRILGRLVSRPYLVTTFGVQNEYGVRIEEIEAYKQYRIPAQEYRPADITVPADYSSAALLLCAAVLVGNGTMKVKIPDGKIPQGDSAMLDHIRTLGVKVKNEGDGSVSVEAPEYLEGGRFDLSDTPDLIPPLAVLGLKSKKKIEIVNVGHAKYKETNRIKVPAEELRKLGLETGAGKTSLSVRLGDGLRGALLDSHDDHRLFMAFFNAAMYVGKSEVLGEDSVDVSFPGYLREMKALGAVFRN